MRALIFDLDGVLVSTDAFHYQAWKQLTDRLKIEFDETVNNRLRGISRMESLEIILEQYHGAPFSYTEKCMLADEKNGIYRKLLETMRPEDVSEEVRETLRELRRRGMKLAVGSSSRNTRFILKQTGLEEMFDAVSDGTNISRSKPDPEVFIKAAFFLDEDPKECMVVEDARAGIDAAKSGGMKTAGLGEAAVYERTDYPLESFSDLLKIRLFIDHDFTIQMGM